MKKIFDPFTDTPKPTHEWRVKEKKDQLNIINMFIIDNKYDSLEAIDIKESGEVLIRLNKYLPASSRGDYLLNFEKELKKIINPGLYVMIEPMGDKNSLRKFRGIQINKGYEE